MKRLSPLKTLTALALLAAAPVNAQVATGFCFNYTQVSSNAGACPTCTIQVEPVVGEQSYIIRSNNGWSATASWANGNPQVAFGLGEWGQNNGDFSGQGFGINLTAQGEQAVLQMTHFEPRFGTVNAVMQCAS